MNINASIGGIATTAKERALALVHVAAARREAELGAEFSARAAATPGVNEKPASGASRTARGE